MAPHLRRGTPRPGPGSGVLRPVAARHHAPYHRYHPWVHAAMRDAPQPRRLDCSSSIPLALLAVWVESVELVHQVAERPGAEGRAVIGKHAQREDRPPPVLGPSRCHDGHAGLLGLKPAAPLDTILEGTARQWPERKPPVGLVHRSAFVTASPASAP